MLTACRHFHTKQRVLYFRPLHHAAAMMLYLLNARLVRVAVVYEIRSMLSASLLNARLIVLLVRLFT
jgi:hypothetical protein